MFCKKCGKEIDDKAASCIHCGASVENKPVKKPIFKKWWFWVIIAVVVLVIIGSSGGSESGETPSGGADSTQSEVDSPSKQEEKINYEKVDLKTMMDDLDANALKAEKTYQDKYVEVVGKIVNFDSDGAYISIQPVDANEWSFDSVQCNIENDAQRDFLLEKKTGDTVTIKGQIVSIGEVLGYSVEIAEVY